MVELQGIPVSPGVAIGPALVFDREGYRIARCWISPSESTVECERLWSAIRHAAHKLESRQQQTAAQLGNTSARFSPLNNRSSWISNCKRELEQMILTKAYSAEYAVSEVLTVTLPPPQLGYQFSGRARRRYPRYRTSIARTVEWWTDDNHAPIGTASGHREPRFDPWLKRPAWTHGESWVSAPRPADQVVTPRSSHAVWRSRQLLGLGHFFIKYAAMMRSLSTAIRVESSFDRMTRYWRSIANRNSTSANRHPTSRTAIPAGCDDRWNRSLALGQYRIPERHGELPSQRSDGSRTLSNRIPLPRLLE